MKFKCFLNEMIAYAQKKKNKYYIYHNISSCFEILTKFLNLSLQIKYFPFFSSLSLIIHLLSQTPRISSLSVPYVDYAVWVLSNYPKF